MKPRSLIFLLLLLVLASCAQGSTELRPPDIRYGEDVCAECNMIISDPRFATAYAYEVGPGRYQTVQFDDIGDMLVYADKHPEHKVVAWYVHDYESKEWTDATTARYVVSSQVETPMASGIVSFASRDRAEAMAYALHSEAVDWNTLREKFAAGEVGVGMAGAAMPMAGHDHAAADQPDDQPTTVEAAAQGREIEAEVDGYHVHLIAQEPLHAGYNALRVHLTAPSGQPVENAEVTWQPMMTMLDGNHHSSPAEGPVQEAPGMYRGAVAFSMPDGPDLGSWFLAVAFTDPATGGRHEATFDVDVASSKLHGSFMAPGDRKVFLAVVSPTTPTVGKQPFEVLAFEKKGMMEWPPLDDLVLEITPEMPTMGHGSPGNVHPTAQGNGHYQGTVNFTMAGPWTVTVVAKQGDAVLGQVVFEFEVR